MKSLLKRNASNSRGRHLPALSAHDPLSLDPKLAPLVSGEGKFPRPIRRDIDISEEIIGEVVPGGRTCYRRNRHNPGILLRISVYLVDKLEVGNMESESAALRHPVHGAYGIIIILMSRDIIDRGRIHPRLEGPGLDQAGSSHLEWS